MFRDPVYVVIDSRLASKHHSTHNGTTTMFGLRSSPSTLVVPCSLRGAVTAEAGMGFAPRRLSAPRPKRVVMPIMYYADVVGASAGGGGTGLGYSPAAGPPSAAVSDYAGVFEAGCDPAQVRASLHRGSKPVETSVARAPLEEEETTPASSVAYNHGGRGGGGGGGGRSVFDDEADCLFPMDGLKDSVPDRAGGVCSGGGIAAAAGGVGIDGGMSAAVGKTTTPIVAVAAGGGKRSVHAPAATPPTAPRGAAVEKSAVYRGATMHQRRASRVIAAPGRRCVAGGGMYRLRLSTSC